MEKYILMLEDDPDDRFITETTLNELGLDVDIQFANNSTQFFNRLDKPIKPFLILIDYNSAPLNAVEILRQLKNDIRFNSIPVVILGDSASQKYINECYQYGASSFIKKPSSVEDTRAKIHSFFKYWLQTVEA